MIQEYSIATKYTKNPGARYERQGNYSGEHFRKTVLEPFFNTKRKGDILSIDFNGLNGYPSSFLEEAFGGIARIYPIADVLGSMKFSCTENPLIVEDIISYIKQERVSI